MHLKKTLLWCLATGLFVNLVFAEGIASKEEAHKYFNEGVKAQKAGDFEKAQKEYSMTAMLTSRYNKFIMQNRGVMYAQRGDYVRAAQAFKEVLSADPTYMPAKINLGLIYDLQADRCTALEYWADLLNLERVKPKTFVIEEEQKPGK